MKRALIVAGVIALGGAAPAGSVAGPEAALRALLASSSLPIAPSSSCYGIIPGIARPTLGDLLATPLAALDGGENRVSGGCEGGRCRVQITHAAGEDVFAYDYRFSTARGRLVAASLRCVSTP